MGREKQEGERAHHFCTPPPNVIDELKLKVVFAAFFRRKDLAGCGRLFVAQERESSMVCIWLEGRYVFPHRAWSVDRKKIVLKFDNAEGGSFQVPNLSLRQDDAWERMRCFSCGHLKVMTKKFVIVIEFRAAREQENTILSWSCQSIFSRQDKILFILDTTILILYRKLYIYIVSIIVLNFEARQYNIKINLAISGSPIILKLIFCDSCFSQTKYYWKFYENIFDGMK